MFRQNPAYLSWLNRKILLLSAYDICRSNCESRTTKEIKIKIKKIQQKKLKWKKKDCTLKISVRTAVGAWPWQLAASFPPRNPPPAPRSNRLIPENWGHLSPSTLLLLLLLFVASFSDGVLFGHFISQICIVKERGSMRVNMAWIKHTCLLATEYAAKWLDGWMPLLVGTKKKSWCYQQEWIDR